MSNVSTVDVTLDVSKGNPTLRDLSQFIDEAREHGADSDSIVDVGNYRLRVTLS